MSVSFVLPPASADLGLSSADKGWLTASIFAGMMVGSYMWGILADINGRRATLLWSLAVNSAGGLASSFAQQYWLFLLLRFISGIGVGGSMPVIFAYYTEFQPKAKRGHMISLLATFWMMGNIIAGGLAWLIIPYEGLGVFSPGFTYNSWRIYLSICVLPAFTSSLFFAVMPESPKFLMMKGKELASIRILQQIFQTNNPTKDLNKDFEVTHLDISTDREYHSNSGCAQKSKAFLHTFFASVAQLFRPPLTSISVVLTIIYFTLSFGYYGMFMWFPELFNRMEMYGGSPCHPGSTDINATVPSDDVAIGNVYFASFLTSISNLPGNILTFLIIDRVGRKVVLSISMVLSGFSVFLIVIMTTKTQSIIMSCIFGGISVMGWNSLDVIGVELYPTNLRTTANGVLMGVGRIAAILGNVIFGQLVDVYCMVPMVMVAVLMCFGGLASIKLPATQYSDLS